MRHASKFFLLSLLVLLFVVGLVVRPKTYYPVIHFSTPTGLEFSYYLQGEKGFTTCEITAQNFASITLQQCNQCSVSSLACNEKLNLSEQAALSAPQIDLPSAVFPGGVVTFRSPNPNVALTACRAGERAATKSGETIARCYPKGSRRVDLPEIGNKRNAVIEYIGISALVFFLAWLALDRYIYDPSNSKRNILRRGLLKLSQRPRRIKQAILITADVVAVYLSIGLSITLTTDTASEIKPAVLSALFFFPLMAIPIFARFGLYHHVIRFIDLPTVTWAAAKSTLIYTVALATFVITFISNKTSISIPILNAVFTLVFICGHRMLAFDLLKRNSAYLSRPAKPKRRVVIYGAGASGVQVVSALRHSPDLHPVGFVDDSVMRIGQRVSGLYVYSPTEIQELISQQNVTNVILAMPSVSRKRRLEIIGILEPLSVKVQTLPNLSDFLQDSIRLQHIKDIGIEDLLGRDPIPPDPVLLTKTVSGKNVMVTGAGGSIGAELCRQIAKLKPKKLILFEQNEYALYSIQREIKAQVPSIELIEVLGNVSNESKLSEILKTHDVNTIYHAAAYKHVPLVENNPIAGIVNNVLGTWIAARTAYQYKVSTFVLISTDKAVRPTNVMGATKRFAEMILQMLSREPGVQTCFTMVRFGNVLGSSGSVVPLFQEQIRNGGPVTVTHPEVTRYFMTIPEAAQLVIQASSMAEGGEVFVLDMGESVKIINLAQRMIRLSGLSIRDKDNPEGDIEIEICGLRPGEKLFEELLVGKNCSATLHPRIQKADEPMLSSEELHIGLDNILSAASQNDAEGAVNILKKCIPEYQPAKIE